MPHGGYHGVVKVGNTIVQQGSPAGAPPGQGGQYNPQGYATEMAGSPAPSTTQNIEKQIEDKKKEIEALNRAQSDTTIYSTSAGFPVIQTLQGPTGVDAKGLATLQNIQNQQLNNLLRQQQEENLRRSILSSAGKGVLNKSDLTGFEGGVLGIRTGDFEDVPAATVINPFTGEKIVTKKAREGLSTPEYNKFIQQLYSTNPELYEQTFPVASGNLAQPILARLLEGGFMKDAGRLAGNVREGIGSFVDTITGGRFTPTGGTVRPSDVGTSDVGLGIGSPEIAPKMQDGRALFANVPDQFRQGFIDFYNKYPGPKAGGMAITPVTLPDGSVIEFGDTGTAAIFREYLESLGISQPPATGVDKIASQPTGITGFDVDKFYASLPQFQQSYSQQGVSPSLLQFLETAQRFPTV